MTEFSFMGELLYRWSQYRDVATVAYVREIRVVYDIFSCEGQCVGLLI